MTDIIDFEYLQDKEKERNQKCVLIWQPDKLSESSLSKLFRDLFIIRVLSQEFRDDLASWYFPLPGRNGSSLFTP